MCDGSQRNNDNIYLIFRPLVDVKGSVSSETLTVQLYVYTVRLEVLTVSN